MIKQSYVVENPRANIATIRRLRTFSVLTIVGAVSLVLGAIHTDFGSYADLPAIGSLGSVLSAAAGLGLVFLPIGLRAIRLSGTGALANAGTALLAIGICLASIADVPTILDPKDLESDGAFGPIGFVLISAGFLLWFVVILRTGALAGWRQYLFLATGLGFPLTIPTVQLPLFVVPNGRPSFLLLAGALGVLQLMMGIVLRGQSGPTVDFSRQAF